MKKQRVFDRFFVWVATLLMLTMADIAAASASLNDYWIGQADWKLLNKWSENDLGGGDTTTDGIHIAVVGNDWYLFTRKTFPGNAMGTEVRHSSNQGWNWSAPVDIIAPEPETPWAYAATDGQPFYDSNSNRWHYIFQCMDKSPEEKGIWHGCYAYKDGRNPMGYWETPNKTTALITPGSLWRAICQPGDSCYVGTGKTLIDEGTFGSFIEGDTVWISFHGHHEGTKSFRGLVKTHKDHIADRSKWIIVANDVPYDAILGPIDGKPWREDWGQHDPVGPGHGSILKDGDYYYIFPEIANNHLGGLVPAGQKWDVGLLRTKNLSSTSWEQLNDNSTGEYRNPVLYSSWPPLQFPPKDPNKPKDTIQLLTLQYPRLFKDASGNIYMIVARNYCDYPEVEQPDIGTCNTNSKNRDISAIYLYRLEKSNQNILKNGDLWIAADPYWHQRNKSNLVIYRRFWLASDGNQFMQFNCGAACQSGASIYQVVKITDDQRGRSFTFGGKFRVAERAGNLHVTVHQLRANGSPISSHDTPVTLIGSTYQDLAGSSNDAVIHQETATLRYEIYPQTPDVNFRADEMYLRLGDPASAKPTLPSTNPSATEWTMSASGIGHVIGRAESGGWSANVAQDAAGFLQFGPYTTALGAGQHTAYWDLLIDNNSGSDNIVQLQVYDASDGQTLAWRNLKRHAWTSSNMSQRFELSFSLSSARSGHAIEFRAWWFDSAYVRERLVGVQPLTATPVPGPKPTLSCSNMTPISWDMFSTDISHVIGRQDNEGWSANTLHDQAGYLQFGPYVKTLSSAGTYTASWRLMIDNNSAGADTVAKLEVADFDSGQQILASKELTRNAWRAPFTYQTFDLPFTLNASRSGHALEFRIWWEDRAYIRQQTVSVRCSSTPPLPTPTPRPNPTPTPKPNATPSPLRYCPLRA